MILVDTSVWIDYFRDASTSPAIPRLLENNELASHPWIDGELLVGQIGSKRRQILFDMGLLPHLSAYSIQALSEFVEKETLFGQGLSLTDVQLLYASIIEDAKLWTHDKALAKASRRFGVCYAATF